MIVQLCGLSGSGKSTLSDAVKDLLSLRRIAVEVIDGDEYRKIICPDLGFSRADRNANIHRLAYIASRLSAHGIVAIICAINPYENIRKEIEILYPNVKNVFISCNIEELKVRDTKGLYRKALLPSDHPNKVTNLSGINDPFEIPVSPSLTINTDKETVQESANKLAEFILQQLGLE